MKPSRELLEKDLKATCVISYCTCPIVLQYFIELTYSIAHDAMDKTLKMTHPIENDSLLSDV